jgi:hypothetical protein
MTSEERIERLTAGLAGERRKDREEYKILWRDTQRQINEMGMKLSEVGTRLVQLSEADSRLEARIEQLAEESRAANQRPEERIGSLVSAIGQFLTKSQQSRRSRRWIVPREGSPDRSRTLGERKDGVDSFDCGDESLNNCKERRPVAARGNAGAAWLVYSLEAT